MITNNKFKVNWLNMSQINEIMTNSIKCKEQILPQTLQKWNAIDKLSDTKQTDFEIQYQ